MLIIAGSGKVDPQRRDEALANYHDAMLRSRAEAGCLDYVFSADPVEPDRILLFERWETAEHLDAHLAAMTAARAAAPPADPDRPVVAMDIQRYEISSTGPVRPGR